MRIRVEHNRSTRRLTIWLGDPRDERSRTPTADVVLIKDAAGGVIGLEKQNVPSSNDVHVETTYTESF